MKNISIYEVQHCLNDIHDRMQGGAPQMAVQSLQGRFGKVAVEHVGQAHHLFRRSQLIEWFMNRQAKWSFVRETTSSPYWYWNAGQLRPMNERDLLNVFDTLALRVNVDQPEMDIGKMDQFYSAMFDQGKITQIRDGLYCQFGDFIDSELQDRGFYDRHDTLARLGQDFQSQVKDWDVEHDDIKVVQEKLAMIEQVRTSPVPYWSVADSLGNVHEHPIALSKSELDDIIESMVSYID